MVASWVENTTLRGCVLATDDGVTMTTVDGINIAYFQGPKILKVLFNRRRSICLRPLPPISMLQVSSVLSRVFGPVYAIYILDWQGVPQRRGASKSTFCITGNIEIGGKGESWTWNRKHTNWSRKKTHGKYMEYLFRPPLGATDFVRLFNKHTKRAARKNNQQYNVAAAKLLRDRSAWPGNVVGHLRWAASSSLSGRPRWASSGVEHLRGRLDHR